MQTRYFCNRSSVSKRVRDAFVNYWRTYASKFTFASPNLKRSTNISVCVDATYTLRASLIVVSTTRQQVVCEQWAVFKLVFTHDIDVATFYPGDLKTWEKTGAICHTESICRLKLLCSQNYGRFLILFTKHNYELSTSFIKGKQRYKWFRTTGRIPILLLVLGQD